MSVEYFYLILFIIAALYAAVGHGGASGYLALMAIYGIAPREMKPTALVLNLFVSLISFTQYYRQGYFKLRTFVPVALASVPFAFIGGTIDLEDTLYKRILGILLLFPVIRFFFFKSPDDSELKNPQLYLSLIFGGIIGLFSGMIGIGGGILLSPLLILLKWTNQKETAAISAAFIFVNSVAGLAGMSTGDIKFTTDMWMYIACAFSGGLLGAYLASKKLNQNGLKYVLGIVLLMASYKLISSTI